MCAAGRIVCDLVILTLSLAPRPLRAQSPGPPRPGRAAWYDSMMKKCNPSDFNYGAWLEKRRRTFLEVTVKEPRFWYSLSVTAAALALMAAYARLFFDHRRTMRITAEMMADLYSHDLYSRRTAKEAIEKYNEHIEKCNRAVEAAESANGRPGWGKSEIPDLRAELQRLASQLEATTQDRCKLQEELRQKSLVVADLSSRLDALAKKGNGAPETAGAAEERAKGDGAGLIGQINRLQEELYAERQKNRRLRGAR